MNEKQKKPIEKANFGNTAGDYRKHRAGFPASLYQRLAEWQIGTGNQRIVDLGTGTGTLARGFASRGNHVTGIDPEDRMLTQARELDAEVGVSVTYKVASAEHTGLPGQSADVVSAGQCWHWFNRPRAIAEVARILKPGGVLLIAHFDWIPLSGNLVRMTEKLIEQHNPDWSGGNWHGIYGQWLRDLGEAGFKGIESFSYDEATAYSFEAWRGRIRASAGISASLSPKKVERFDRDLQEMLAKHFSSEPHLVPHRVFAVKGTCPGS
jgi:ubiquinone/menaquinone biosynthesis C-methylase UbiE